jgi:hypothetical protein
MTIVYRPCPACGRNRQVRVAESVIGQIPDPAPIEFWLPCDNEDCPDRRAEREQADPAAAG